MAVEKKWLAVPATPFTADGTQFGVVTVADTAGFKVKGVAAILANTLPPLEVQIQRVISPTQMIVGKPGTQPTPNHFIDISAYTTALSATIAFPEQDKNKIKPDDMQQATYEGDPTVAWRVVFVDPYGRFYSTGNPLPISFDGTVSVGEVEIKGSPSGYLLNVNQDGSINVNVVETPVSGQTEKNIFGEVSSVASGVQTQIAFYTVPFGDTSVLHRISVSGDNIARFDVYLNGSLLDTKRTWYADFNANFEFITGTNTGTVLNAGDTIAVKVLHSSPFMGTFEARIQVLEIS